MTIPLHAIAPPPAAPISIRAQLVQRTPGLAAPIGPRREIEVTLAGAGQPIQVDVALPAVRSETGFELLMESRAAAGDEWRSAEPVALRAYPQDLLAPLRSWAQTRRLYVIEDRNEPRLSVFFENNDIRFERPGATPRPGVGPAVALYAGKAARDGRDESGPAVFFTERAAGLPHVVLERGDLSATPTVTVEMALLDRLETDPAAQQTFVRIFELLEARADTR